MVETTIIPSPEIKKDPVKRNAGKLIPPVKDNKKDDLREVLGSISAGLGVINERLDGFDGRLGKIEDGGANDFKKEAKPEDIAYGTETRKGIDPKISKLVDEMLGIDFGVEVKPLGDRPGFRLTIIVPHRLSDHVVDKRPVRDPETGKYKTDKAENVIFEDYIPEDRRSKILSSSESYDSVRSHCDKVRGYIVGYFQKISKPLPEFKIK